MLNSGIQRFSFTQFHGSWILASKTDVLLPGSWPVNNYKFDIHYQRPIIANIKLGSD